MRRFLLVSVLFVGAALAGCSDLVVGDSLVVQTALFDQPAAVGGQSGSTLDGVTLKGVASTAPCDYVPSMAADYAKYQPKRITLAFSGNADTPCMRDRYGRALTGSALVLKYHDDLVTLTKYFGSKGVSVIYSAPPCVSPNLTGRMNGDPAIRAMERGLASRFVAQRQHVAYSEYAALQLCPNWTYVGDYRSVDGLHLTVSGAQIYGRALRQESKRTYIP